MRTAAFETAFTIQHRLNELKILISRAELVKDCDEPLYNALCRSCSVLIASHIEGAIKEICESVTRDLQYFIKDFSKMPAAWKRSFCYRIAYYEGVPAQEINKRIDQLIQFFDKHTVPITTEAFTYLDAVNKNPKPSSIDKPFEKFGINNALQALESPFFLQAFTLTSAKRFTLEREIRRVRCSLYAFPYKQLPEHFFAKISTRDKKTTNSLWYTFLEDLVTRRHTIAHGDTLENPTTATSLESDLLKAEFLLYGLMYYFCSSVVTKAQF